MFYYQNKIYKFITTFLQVSLIDMEPNFTESQIQELSNSVIQYYKFEILLKLIEIAIDIGVTYL